MIEFIHLPLFLSDFLKDFSGVGSRQAKKTFK